MCRHLAYLGRATNLHSLVYGPPHSLSVQAYAPRLQRSGRVNADGFGVGWYAEGRAEPVRYRRAQPLWTDVSFAQVCDVLAARCVVAAVRCATPGFPVEESCTQPFTAGPWLFSHNGRVDDFGEVEPKLRELAGAATAAADARASVDSALLFAVTLARWRSGQPLGAALAEVVEELRRLTTGRFNLLATDGATLAATAAGETLFTRADATAMVIASEPYDDGSGWREVPPDSLVTADADGLHLAPL